MRQTPETNELNGQLAQLRAERVVLDRQLRGNLDAPARAQLQAKHAELDAQIAKVQADLAVAHANMPVGTPEQVINVPPTPPPAHTGPQWDPDLIVALGGAIIVFVLFPLAIGFARRMWRGKAEAPPIPHAISEIPSRLDRLEQAVDAIAIEVERISEGQRFVSKLMAERNGAADAKPALGAGPAEPVRVGEREALKERK